MVTPAELKELVPQVDLTGGGRYPVLGASHTSRLRPPDTTVSPGHLPRGASQRGVHVLRHTPVTGLLRDGERVVGVETRHGPIAAGVVLSAVGGRITRMAAHAGVRLPIRTHPLHAFVTNDYAQGFGPILASTELSLLRLADRARPDAHRRRVRLAAVVLARVVVRRASFVFVQDDAASAVPPRPAHPADVGRDLRHLGGLLADHGREGVDGFMVTTGWGTWGFKAIPAGGEGMAELIATGKPSALIVPFSLDRFRRDHVLADQGSAGTR